jgi:hypothetical protein
MAGAGRAARGVRLEHAELVAPRAAQDPEVKATLLLMVIAGRAERLQASDLRLNIVGLQVEVHPLLGDLLVVGLLERLSGGLRGGCGPTHLHPTTADRSA